MKSKFLKRVLSGLLCVALLLCYLPAAAQAAQVDGDDRVADLSTMDSWKTTFLPDPLNTENAGAVWTDKSVFTDDDAFASTGISQTNEDSFLVALSAMASNMSVTGVSNVPTDTVMILDLSSSMYDGSDRDPSTVRTMLSSVNASIKRLQSLNENNRVAVVVYYGGIDRNQSTSANSMVLLPLDRYSGTDTYLKANVSGGKLISVAVNAGVKNSAGNTVAQTTRTVTDVAGTYAQLGILDAMDLLLAADTTVSATASYQPGADRVPVMIFMSDGEPTAATHEFTKKVDAGMGNNTVSIRNASETDFVTQLTAAYAKAQVDSHYGPTDPLFYTLSLGSSVSLSVMDPANHTTATIDGYWEKLLTDGEVSITVYNSPNGWSAPTVKKTYTVTTATVDGADFPSKKSQRDYVDKAFTASTAGGLTDAFDNIIDQIDLVSKYTPTLVSGNADLSGYISFVDKIGQYMTVSDIKGVLINNTLYSGAELASNFVEDGGALGSYDAPTDLGTEMLHAVQARIGLESADAARTLIALAYEYGQLSYHSPTDYSNYIGWYANAAGEFLAFWHEGITTAPEGTGDPDTDPVYIIRSYGYLGAVDESHGVSASDMMYATVQVRQNIATGEEAVVFAVPAALIPLITYQVTLDMDGEMESLTASGAEHPIRLVYEVGLQEHINGFNLSDTVSDAYRAANTNADGSVSFYTNQYEVDLSTGYGKVNTYSYFEPSRQNDKYYYLQDSPVFTDTKGTPYTGDAQPSGEFYRSYTVYTETGAQTIYRRLSDAALATAKRQADGTWYIGAGNVHVNLDGYTVQKAENLTGTLPQVNVPYVDVNGHSVNDLGHRFIVGSTLGNNGKLTLKPETGIEISKTMAQGATAPTEAFDFTITNLTDSKDSGTYAAVIKASDGTQRDTTVRFAQGQATVKLEAGQTMYIGGMTAGTVYTVEEVPTVEYLPLVDNFTLTLTEGTLSKAHFVNADRGVGSLLIAKEVIHTLGSDYQLPQDLSFQIHVKLTGVGVANRSFSAVHSDGSTDSVTTDAEGCFTARLGHDQQLWVLGLPEGTVAQVTEPQPGDGFTASYEENGEAGDGIVTVSGDSADVTVVNTYTPDSVRPVNVVLQGRKELVTAADSWNGAEFTFLLQKWNGESWATIATATAAEDHPTFDFNEALSKEQFTAPGTYTYQVLEFNGGKTVDGITYDATAHTFGITVTDLDMDGQLEISKVVSFHAGKDFPINADGNWQIDITFTNHYHASDCYAVLDVQKQLRNPSGSPLVSLSGFRFGLYEDGDLVAVSQLTDGAGEAQLLLHYTLADVGLHTYILKELVPENPIVGMIYDDRTYEVQVLVSDHGDGTMSAQITSIEGDKTPVFTNTYTTKEATLELDFTGKNITGRELIPQEFRFVLEGVNTSLKLTGTNDGDGNVRFTEALTFDRVGTYLYHLYEEITDVQGVTFDDAVYTVSVTVTDQGGELKAEYQILNLVGTQVVFENTFTPDPITYTVSGTKKLVGRELLNEEFHFVLTEAADEMGTVLPDARVWETTNFMDGRFHFEALSFAEPGSYHYTVHERPSGSADYGITYDTARYVVTVTVDSEWDGMLFIRQVSCTLLGEGGVEAITFTNRYSPQPTSVELSGRKELIGAVLSEGHFEFQLYEADEAWTQIDLLETVANEKNGLFTFSQLDYDTPGTRYYLVREVNGGKTLNGIDYDDTVYRVTVEVTDDLKGQLHAEITVQDSEGIPREQILFRNIYEEEPLPKTGDTNLVLWLLLMAVSCGGALSLITLKKKLREQI